MAYLENGNERNITAPCSSRIKQFDHLLSDLQEDSQIFVIVSTIAADGLKLTHSTSGKFASEGIISVPIADGSQATNEAAVSISDSETAEIEFKQTMYLGFAAPWRIVEWAPSSLTGSSLASIRAVPTD